MYLMTSTRCGISAKQLEQEIGVTYETAWRMFHLIRNSLMEQTDEPLSGDVEMDETYVGGKPRGSEILAMSREGLSPMQAGQAAGRAKKTTVFGMVERGGQVSAYVVPQKFQETAFRHIEGRVLSDATVYTDKAAAYSPLGAKGYQHRRIHHAAKVYGEGNVHTNTIEGFWSLVKRGIGGTHHAVSAKYLQGYLNEYVWRYNRRDDPEAHSWRYSFGRRSRFDRFGLATRSKSRNTSSRVGTGICVGSPRTGLDGCVCSSSAMILQR